MGHKKRSTESSHIIYFEIHFWSTQSLLIVYYGQTPKLLQAPSQVDLELTKSLAKKRTNGLVVVYLKSTYSLLWVDTRVIVKSVTNQLKFN